MTIWLMICSKRVNLLNSLFMTTSNKSENNQLVEAMFKAGAHFGFSRSRRHPSVSPYIFGMKNRVEIFDLDKTKDLLEAAKEFITSIAKTGGQILLVGGKSEAKETIGKAAVRLNMPYVNGRWLGGTLTNLKELRKRVERMETLRIEKEKGELVKYTKKERLLIDREIAKLERFFGGIAMMKEKPKALFVIDPRYECIAVTEARKQGVPVIALAGSDCHIGGIDYPIVGNDTTRASINFFVEEIIKAFESGINQRV